MEKKRVGKLLGAVLALALLAACGSEGVPSAATAPVPEDTSPASSGITAESGGGAPSEEKRDYSGIVFDTSNDAGKLTARYLAMKATYVSDGDKVNVGDCTVYTSPDGLVMMVDCGNPASFPEIDAQLREMGIEEIDIFVMSHPHADHIGCFAELAGHYPIKQLYKNAHEYDSGTYAKAVETAEELGIPVTVLHDGDSFSFGGEVEVEVCGPSSKFEGSLSNMTAAANNASIAMRLCYGDSSFWTAGDTYVPGEQEILRAYGEAIRSDVVKMNHHGYETSNGRDYVETLRPKVAVSMHESMTSRTVALRHSTRGIATFYTCMDGTVRVSTAGDGTYDVQTQYIRTQVVCGEPAADGHYVIG